MSEITITNVATMSSREIAQLTGSTHDNVLKTVRGLVERGVVSGNETPYTHPQNGQTYFEFRLSYRDTMVVVSGYSVELRAKIIDRWQELEAHAAQPAPQFNIPQTLPDALRLAADLADQRDRAEAARLIADAQLAIAAPKAEALDRIATVGEGMYIPRVAAPMLHVPEGKLFQRVYQMEWMYRGADGKWRVYAEAWKKGWVDQKMHPYTDSKDGETKYRPQVYITAKGMAKLAEIFEREGAPA